MELHVSSFVSISCWICFLTVSGFESKCSHPKLLWYKISLSLVVLVVGMFEIG